MHTEYQSRDAVLLKNLSKICCSTRAYSGAQQRISSARAQVSRYTLASMDHSVLIQLFDATFNPDAAIRKSAEQELRKVSEYG